MSRIYEKLLYVKKLETVNNTNIIGTLLNKLLTKMY